jgi:hypothetical protein
MLVDEQNILTSFDRCDRCDAQAYVKVIGTTGELLFCNHHYNNVLKDPASHDKLLKFTINIVDERSRLL